MWTDLGQCDIQLLGTSDSRMIGDRPTKTRGDGQRLIETASVSELVCYMEQLDTHGLNGIGSHDIVSFYLVVGGKMEVCFLAGDVVMAASQFRFRHVVRDLIGSLCRRGRRRLERLRGKWGHLYTFRRCYSLAFVLASGY